MGDHDDLLARFQPVLRYDSNEQFFADSAEQLLVMPGVELRRKRTETGNGAVLARAGGELGSRSSLRRSTRTEAPSRRATSSAPRARTTASSTARCARRGRS